MKTGEVTSPARQLVRLAGDHRTKQVSHGRQQTILELRRDKANQVLT